MNIVLYLAEALAVVVNLFVRENSPDVGLNYIMANTDIVVRNILIFEFLRICMQLKLDCG